MTATDTLETETLPPIWMSPAPSTPQPDAGSSRIPVGEERDRIVSSILAWKTAEPEHQDTANARGMSAWNQHVESCADALIPQMPGRPNHFAIAYGKGEATMEGLFRRDLAGCPVEYMEPGTTFVAQYRNKTKAIQFMRIADRDGEARVVEASGHATKASRLEPGTERDIVAPRQV